MRISSRTPEGEPQRCRVCGNSSRIELSVVSGDAPCPHCGSLLWLKSARPAVSSPPKVKARAMAKVLALTLCLIAVVLIPVALALASHALSTWQQGSHPFGLGVPEMVVLGIIGIILFGRKLPEVAKSLGKCVVEFRYGMDAHPRP